MAYMANAERGNIFVLTKLGYEKTPNRIKPERTPGSPVKGFENRVPEAWIKKGYVKEVKENGIDRGRKGNLQEI